MVQDLTVSKRLYYKSSPATSEIIQKYVRMAVSTNIRDTSLRTRINNDKVSSKLKHHLLNFGIKMFRLF